MAIYKTTIIGQKKIAENTTEISFKRPENFSFKAGQYIQISISKLLFFDEKGNSRVFSIVSSSLNKEKISVAFRDTGSGFKKTLKKLNKGSIINIEGPHGFYTLPEKSKQQIVLIAGGIGVTPYISMLRFAVEQNYNYPITLLYVNASKERAPYLEELQNLANNIKNLTIKNKFGKIDKQFIKDNIKDVKNCLWHIAGPPTMVDFVRNKLSLLGVNYSQIYYESFTGY